MNEQPILTVLTLLLFRKMEVRLSGLVLCFTVSNTLVHSQTIIHCVHLDNIYIVCQFPFYFYLAVVLHMKLNICGVLFYECFNISLSTPQCNELDVNSLCAIGKDASQQKPNGKTVKLLSTTTIDVSLVSVSAFCSLIEY